jgi:hypothetical protein
VRCKGGRQQPAASSRLVVKVVAVIVRVVHPPCRPRP